MPTIKKISKLTDNKHLNLYQLDAVNKVGREFPYFVASRAKKNRGFKNQYEKPNSGWSDHLQYL